MEIGSIVYHINCGTERFRIKKMHAHIAICELIDSQMVRDCKFQMKYKVQICFHENLRDIPENSNQLSLF